jgi:hypothetical protein
MIIHYINKIGKSIYNAFCAAIRISILRSCYSTTKFKIVFFYNLQNSLFSPAGNGYSHVIYVRDRYYLIGKVGLSAVLGYGVAFLNIGIGVKL